MTQKISIVIPAWNEEAVLPALGSRLTELMAAIPQYDFEAVIVDNGSHDRSYEILRDLNARDPRFKVVSLSRNFSADGGVAAGLRYATGDCAVIMDADLQDPPEVILEFLEKWRQGYDVVYGVIRSREGVSGLRMKANALFYMLLNQLTGGAMPRNVTAFRLMSRPVYETLNRMNESNRFTRGLCVWSGFKQVGVEFDRADRFAGESKAPFWDILKEALDAMFSFSFIPLKAITVLGMFMSLFSFLFLGWQLVSSFIKGTPVPGYLTLITVMLLMFGVLFLILGVIGEYLARIFDEVKARPLYVVRDTIGFNEGFSAEIDRRMPVNR